MADHHTGRVRRGHVDGGDVHRSAQERQRIGKGFEHGGIARGGPEGDHHMAAGCGVDQLTGRQVLGGWIARDLNVRGLKLGERTPVARLQIFRVL